MEAGQPSRTAFVMGLPRARHGLAAPEPKVLEDRLAATLAGVAEALAAGGVRQDRITFFSCPACRSI